MTDLYLIRHGQSVPNVEPIVGGMTGDAGLTELGHRQGALLEDRLRRAPLPVTQLYASTLPRALQTAEYVSRGLGLPVQRDDELHELRPGAADGLSLDEWQRRYPRSPYRDPYEVFAPDGESWATFLARAGTGLVRLLDRHEDDAIAVVCHGGVIGASFALAFGHGPESAVTLRPENTGITCWRLERDAAGRRLWTLLRYDDALHLPPDAYSTESTHEAVPLPTDRDSRADSSAGDPDVPA